MENDRFDRLVKIVARASSRRAALRALAAGATGLTILGVGTHLSDNLAEAAKGKAKGKGKGKKKNDKRTICHCPGGDPAKCNTITVGRKAAENHLEQHCDYPGECQDDVVNPCDLDSECLPVVDTVGNVTEESNGEFTAHAEGTEFGNLIFGLPPNTTFGDLESVASEFEFSEGTCGSGSPRFVVFLENGNCPYAQFPTDLCDEENASGNTGNLIENTDSFVWIDDLKCGAATAPTPVYTYAEVLARYENEVIDQIVLVTDSSGGTKTVTLDPCITIA